MKIFIVIIQVLIVAGFAPLVSGIIRKLKNNMRMRRGPGILQPYYNIAKLFAKDEVVSENASWIFRAAPFIVLGASVFALSLVPVLDISANINQIGDIILIVFVLSLGRFFLALAGLDTGSAFGGMGSSREMFISSLAEPVMLISIFAVSIGLGSTNPSLMMHANHVRFSACLAAVSFFMIMIAETSRLPVDNQETHLELTMVHEAMVLEYSGRSLAFIELAAHIKQILFFTILANVILPVNLPVTEGSVLTVALGLAVYSAKILIIAGIIAVIEVSVAKMRLFRVVDYLSFGFALAVMSLVISAIGL